ncbi:MAG: ATP-grasp domain-containing protein [Bacteroidota bacterium]|nr:ATP-grasp domain-containing protein [Bacteroidota bacterium]
MKKLVENKSFSVLIPDGESIFALKVLRCLGKIKGIHVIILSNDAQAMVRFSRYCDKFITYIEKNEPDRLAAITNTLVKIKADVILPVDIPTIRLISANQKEIEKITRIIPLPVIENIDITDDKWLTYEWMNENKIATPSTVLFQPGNDFEEKLFHLTFPVLIKPRKGSGGEGIEIFQDKESLLSFCEKNTKSIDLIVQSFIKGFDIDCSILCKDGDILAFTIQKRFVYTDQPVSGELAVDFLFHESTYQTVKELAKKFCWSGIAHIDLRYDENDQQIKVIEINPRFWASVTYSILAGINFPYLACLFALNSELPKVEFYSKRLIQLRSAIKIILNKMITRNRKDLYFDNIFLDQVSFKDPLPYFISKYPRIFRKIFGTVS